MTKDKLITLLIEEEKRDRLKAHCNNLGLNVSQLITRCIDQILDGTISIDTPIGTSIDMSNYLTRTEHSEYIDPVVSNLKGDIWELKRSISQLERRLNDLATDKTIDIKPNPVEPPIDKPMDISIGYDHTAFAALIGKHQSTVRRWANGERQIPIEISNHWRLSENKWSPI